MNHDAIRADYPALIAEALDMLGSPELAGLDLALREGLRRYLEDRIETGGFLRRCLENDFAGAVGRAHPHLDGSQFRLIAELLNSGFPAIAWGSPEKVAAWLAEGEEGEADAGSE